MGGRPPAPKELPPPCAVGPAYRPEPHAARMCAVTAAPLPFRAFGFSDFYQDQVRPIIAHNVAAAAVPMTVGDSGQKMLL